MSFQESDFIKENIFICLITKFVFKLHDISFIVIPYLDFDLNKSDWFIIFSELHRW